MAGKALYVPGPSYYDDNVKRFAGWWHILEYQRQALEMADYEVDTPRVPDSLIAPTPSFAKITSYGVAAASMARTSTYDIVLYGPSYGYIPALTHPEAARVTFVWNNAPSYRNRVLEPEYQQYQQTFDHSLIGDLVYNSGLILADRVIACSPFVKGTHGEVIPDDQIGIAPWGVNTQMFQPGLKNERFTVLFVGGDPIRKGFKYLWDAFTELRVNQGLDLDLWVVGFKVEFPKELGGSVQCFGMVQYQEMPGIMARCHVLVCPTIEDGIACVVQEAMACGVVPVATQEAAEVFVHPVFRPDGYRAAGYEVSYRDSETVWRVLRGLYMDWQHCEDLGKEARQLAEIQTWDKFKEAFAQQIIAVARTKC